jgi:hypothetical protein
MTTSNQEHIKTHADLQWCLNVLERIDEVLKRDPISAGDIKSIEWLVKQGLKCKKEE